MAYYFNFNKMNKVKKLTLPFCVCLSKDLLRLSLVIYNNEEKEELTRLYIGIKFLRLTITRTSMKAKNLRFLYFLNFKSKAKSSR